MFAEFEILIGIYSVSVEVRLASYPDIAPLTIEFEVEILPPAVVVNNLPYFDPLVSETTINKTEKPISWSFSLPKVVDADDDEVTLSVEKGAAKFIKLQG